MTPDVTPLVLLVLLTFFFVIALAFTVWAALTVGEAAKRTQQARAHRAERRTTSRASSEPKPWERKPEPKGRKPEAQSTRVAQPSLWERPAEGRTAMPEARQPAPASRKANSDAFERFLESEKQRD